ncbi:MAG: DUF6084 family protein [Acidimicrobiales bacterium]
MTRLSFEVLGARAEPYAASPTLSLRLRIKSDTRLHALALKCQIRIEPQRRTYTEAEEERLYEIFGETPQWGDSLRPFLWTHVSTMVGGFSDSIDVDLPIECTYDFEVAGAKYLHSVEEGEIPILLLFSGQAFADGFGVEPVAWQEEAAFRLPVQVWREMMDMYFPNSGWIRLGRPTIDALTRFKAARTLPTWDQTIEQLLKEAGEEG